MDNNEECCGGHKHCGSDNCSDWKSWGSPIGLSLGIGILMISTGVFLWLLHLAGLIGK
jgi:hypothetical protein